MREGDRGAAGRRGKTSNGGPETPSGSAICSGVGGRHTTTRCTDGANILVNVDRLVEAVAQTIVHEVHVIGKKTAREVERCADARGAGFVLGMEDVALHAGDGGPRSVQIGWKSTRRSSANGLSAPAGIHVTRSRSTTGSAASGVHTSTSSSSPSTIQ